MNLPLSIRRYGSERPLPERTALRAGPLSLVYEAGCLRYIRMGDVELMRRIYVAIRDQNWGTAPDEIRNVEMKVGSESFSIDFDVLNRLGEIEFTWHGAITGDADGTIQFDMDGVAQSSFLRARIGFCVLPPMSVAGQPARVIHVDGSEDRTEFPDAIAPQLVLGGLIKPVKPFEEMKALEYELDSGVMARVEFAGDIFEMEDQRNWTDASYKIYSTPLRLPYPVQVHKGERISQSITLQVTGQPPASRKASQSIPTIIVDTESSRPLPRLGLGQASHGQPLTTLEADRLLSLRLAHLRVDLDLTSADWTERFAQACSDAAAISTNLEVVLYVDDATADQLPVLEKHIDSLEPNIARWIVFDKQGQPASADLLQQVRTLAGELSPDAPVGSGVNGFFTELNKLRPDPGEMDFIAYSLNPQVHAFDNSSVMETPAAQALTVQNAYDLFGHKPVAVTPVTLRPRPPVSSAQFFTPQSPETGAGPAELTELPSYVDERQMSLFGAAWTVASLKHLAEAGADSVTYFETTGWQGVMERDEGCPAPHLFHSLPGAVFPVYHVLADAAEYVDGEALQTESTHPLVVEALALRNSTGMRLLVANKTGEVRTANVYGLTGTVGVTMLDEEIYELKVLDPAQFRMQPDSQVSVTAGIVELTLKPYAVARIDSN